MANTPKNQLSSPLSNGFGRYLLSKGLLTAHELTKIIDELTTSESLITNLATNHYLSSEQLADHVSEYFRMPRYYLQEDSFNSILNRRLHLELIKKHLVLPLESYEQHLLIATSDPTRIDLQELNFLAGVQCQLVIVNHDKLMQLIQRLETQHLEQTFQTQHYHSVNNDGHRAIDELQSDQSVVVTFLDRIFHEAIRKRASDIHFEPYDNFFRIRFRIDGVLHEEIRPPIELANYIAARLKILANLDIAERRAPQDGRFSIVSSNTTRDVRLNTCPISYGEKCVLRLLPTSCDIFTIDQLGMNNDQLEVLQQKIKQPQGMIIVAGPTGSGKATTLYSILAELNQTTKNILTIEDPIEIPLPGINQIQVNLKSQMTFDNVLRACLRQDPDVILVGEIRDTKTAELAISAAHTGHLVLTTLHSNDAFETITRLTNLGISKYNIESALQLIIAQRLIRKLCNHCKKPMKIDHSPALLGKQSPELLDIIYVPSGCSRCNLGFYGRVGIFESITTTQLHESTSQYRLLQSGIEQVKNSKTSLCELQRVLGVVHEV